MSSMNAKMGSKYTIVCTDAGPSYRPCDGCRHQSTTSPTPETCKTCTSMLDYPIGFGAGNRIMSVPLYLEHGTNWEKP